MGLVKGFSLGPAAGQRLTFAVNGRRIVEMVCFPGESRVMLANGQPQSRLGRRQHLLRWFATCLR